MVSAYLEAALADGDPALFTAALGDIATARGMSDIAQKAGVTVASQMLKKRVKNKRGCA